MELWWNDNDGINAKYSVINLSECHFAHHKFLLHWSRNDLAPPRRKDGDYSSKP